jgi:ribosomal silencing factor RsfS
MLLSVSRRVGILPAALLRRPWALQGQHVHLAPVVHQRLRRRGLCTGTPADEEKYSLKDVVGWMRAERADDVRAFRVGHLLSGAVGEYLVFASGRSGAHMRRIAMAVQLEFKDRGVHKFGDHTSAPVIEGKNDDDWMVVDGGTAVVSIMVPEARLRLRLEEHWESQGAEEIELPPDPLATTQPPIADAHTVPEGAALASSLHSTDNAVYQEIGDDLHAELDDDVQAAIEEQVRSAARQGHPPPRTPDHQKGFGQAYEEEEESDAYYIDEYDTSELSHGSGYDESYAPDDGSYDPYGSSYDPYGSSYDPYGSSYDDNYSYDHDDYYYDEESDSSQPGDGRRHT